MAFDHGVHGFPAWRSAQKGKCGDKNRQVRELCPWVRFLTVYLDLFVANEWWGQAVYSSR